MAGGDEQLATTNVKQEKIDPEIEEKIKLLKLKIKQETRESVEKQKVIKNVDTNKRNGSETPSTNEDASDDEDDDVDDGEEEENDENEEDENEQKTNIQTDDKKNIEPVKSSNEILAELFKVFNAEPPKELLNDKELIEKTHRKKKHKKEKKKKRKKSKSRSPAVTSDSEGLTTAEALSKTNGSRHKKKKKHKHKDERDREKSRERNKHEEKYKTKEGASKEKRHRERDSEGESEHCKRKYKDRGVDEKIQQKVRREESKQGEKEKLTIKLANDRTKVDTEKSKNSFYNGFKDDLQIKKENGQKHQKPARSRSHETLSDISLSDEETYLKEKQQMHTEPKQARLDQTKADPAKNSNSSSYSRSNNSFYAGAEETLSREKDRDNRYPRLETKRYHRSRSRTRTRSRSRSRSRSRDLGIDKKRLLEIARKNAISMFKRGNLPGSANMSEEIRDKVLMKMRYGGRTVQDLTDFCKKISNGENLSDLSSDEDSDVDKQGNAKAFHHPFQVKEREPIVMHIRNAIPKVPRPPAAEQTKAITMQFPVSSGQHHRLTETAWVPVDAREKLAPLPALPPVAQATTIFKNATTKNVFEKPIPKQGQQEPAFKAVGVETEVSAIPTPPAQATAICNTVATMTSSAAVPKQLQNTSSLPPAVLPNLSVPPPAPPAPKVFVPDVPIPSTAPPQHQPRQEASIFPDQSLNNYDVASIITKRLNAMRRLQENPTDSEAIKLMYNSQREMTSWASSKHLPGQFTGSTGVKVLSAQELNSGPQVWARRNQMTNTKPVSGGMGMHLLQKMGWKPGEGLGRAKTGQLQPVLLDVKMDKRGLYSKEETNRNSALPPQMPPQQQQHPLHLQQPLPHQQHHQIQQQQQQHPMQPQQHPLQHPMQQHPRQQHPLPQHPLQHLQQPMPMRQKRPLPLPQEALQNKHPVSVLNEMSSKYRWNPPMYRVVNEDGPMHQKMFLFSVTTNGQTYTPDRGSTTKKEAKMIAARYCLQEMGLLPKDQPTNMQT